MRLVRRPSDHVCNGRDCDDFFKGFFTDEDWSGKSERKLNVAVDIAEDKDSFLLEAEVPGMTGEDIKIKVKDNLLSIMGEKKLEEKSKDINFYRTERNWGSFDRSFELPNSVDSENISAEYGNGVLRLTIPKKEESKPREVEIKLN